MLKRIGLQLGFRTDPDYGSEDLTAELKRNSDGTYTLTRLAGSTMKIVVNNKWVKIPKDITFYVK